MMMPSQLLFALAARPAIADALRVSLLPSPHPASRYCELVRYSLLEDGNALLGRNVGCDLGGEGVVVPASEE